MKVHVTLVPREAVFPSLAKCPLCERDVLKGTPGVGMSITSTCRHCKVIVLVESEASLKSMVSGV